MGVLTENEKAYLMRIPTTVEQAQQILERNAQLLERLDAIDDNVVEIGCPHCDQYRCPTCAWYAGGRFKCSSVTFGGVDLNSQSVVVYADTYAYLVFRDDASEEDVEEARIFLQGHMEWAAMVIAAGGVPWPEEEHAAVSSD